MRKIFGLTAALLMTVLVHAAEYKEIGPAWVFQSDLTFEDAKDNLVFAIEGRGLVISYISHASDMLNRTAEAVGVTEPVYGDAEIILFCKSDLSHTMVASNPHNIVLCPYSISVYTLPGEEEAAYLSIPAPYQGDPTIAPITELLIEIIEESIEF
jgi:hypothetical protein